ncbi:MAG: MobA/MobL family protein, partial [Oscillospiraceae bacterium]|nr:MobA/MobL family protein [Oscillospiraceae bacterium]
MAVYHLELQVISRGQGRSAVAAAAYRSGERIVNPWDGVEHDYTHKGGIVYKEIMLPNHAPTAYRNRAALWSAVELSEKAADCRLCREAIIALPRELPFEEQIALVRDYVRENFVSLGMCADIAIHNPVLTDDLHRPIDKDGNPTTDPAQYQYINPHAHILLTVRAIDEKGRWEAKTKKEYLCKRDGEQQGMTAEEFAAAKEQGWEKQYQYRTEEGRAWLTPSEADALGLNHEDRVSRSPRSAPHGRENPTTADWNSKTRLLQWRDAWAEAVNRRMEKLHIPERIYARSYADRGIDRIPSVREG